MPAFSFEKISPPVGRVATTTPEKKHRGMIVQILDRIVERRGKRVVKSDQAAPSDPKPQR
jgi:hypothetical protein